MDISYITIPLISSVSGFVVGLFGAGGGIITVPILVYIFGYSQYGATSYSMIFIGANASISTIHAQKVKQIQWKSVFSLGLTSFCSVFLVRTFLAPNIPSVLFSTASISISRDTILMLLFSFLLFTTVYMMYNRKENNSEEVPKPNILRTILFGLFLGGIVGIFGVGGGFLTTPYFVIFDRQPIKIAIGTSTALLLLNSLVGIVGDIFQSFSIDVLFVLLFLSGSFLGVFLGIAVKSRIDNSKLSKLFIGIVLSLGIFIFVKEVSSLF